MKNISSFTETREQATPPGFVSFDEDEAAGIVTITLKQSGADNAQFVQMDRCQFSQLCKPGVIVEQEEAAAQATEDKTTGKKGGK